MRTTLLAECAAEFFGTLVLILLGCGVVASVVLFGNGTPGEIVNGGVTNINIAWGLAVTMGIYTAGKISGAHLNPAVTIAMAVFRGLGWGKVLPYIVAQVAGAFTAAAIVFLNYRPAFEKFDPALEKTAGVFATFPAFPGQPGVGFIDQVIGTALLLFLICAITDERNSLPAGNLAPVIIGLVVVVIGMSFGALHGYAINPARDFGPRLMTAVMGFKNNGLTDGSGVFWVPIVAPILGGILGTAAYDLGLRRFLPEA
ncbi:MAG: aquaporin family protein [Acidobacteria bacterium]|nr:aquaporin family protein [Acidobacteriota bacterium]